MNTSVLRVALGQFFVQPESSTNLAIVRDLIDRAQEGGAGLLVLPEGIIARKPGDNTWPVTHREPIDGPFVTGLLKATVGKAVTVVCTAQIALPNEGRYAFWSFGTERFSFATRNFICMMRLMPRKASMPLPATSFRLSWMSDPSGAAL